jgi:hypothetical protein
MSRWGMLEFRGRTMSVREGALAVLTEALERESRACVDAPRRAWWNDLCARWRDDELEMPPGCVFITLERYLGSEEEVAWLVAGLRSARERARVEGPDFLPDVCERVLGLVEAPSAPGTGPHED